MCSKTKIKRATVVTVSTIALIGIVMALQIIESVMMISEDGEFICCWRDIVNWLIFIATGASLVMVYRLLNRYVEVVRQRDRAEETLKEKSKLEGAILMARGACHDMAQPMQAIVGYAELMEGSFKHNGTVGKDHLSCIIEQVLRLRTTLNKTHKLVKLETFTHPTISGGDEMIDIDASAIG